MEKSYRINGAAMWAVIFTFLFVVGACDQGSDFEGEADDATELRPIDTTDEGTVHPLRSSEVAVIELAENSSTGFMWQPTDESKEEFRIFGSEYVQEKAMPGAPGTRRFFVAAKKAGTATLEFVAARSGRTLDTRRVEFNATGAYTGDFQMPTPAPAPAYLMEGVEETRAYPSSFSVCDANGCPWAKDQGADGTCWAFATVGTMEVRMKQQGGGEVDYSEEYLIDCNDMGYNENGGWWAHRFHKDDGVGAAINESSYPYVGTRGTCASAGKPTQESLSSFACLGGSTYDWCSTSIPSASQIKQAIYDHGPVTATVCASNWPSNYDGSYVFSSHCPTMTHAIVIVGWNDSFATPYFIVRNSWGPNWGDAGYIYLKQGISLLGGNLAWVDWSGGGGAPAETCWDGIQNQGETGVDCGGPCSACAAAETCWDGIQNQGETGVDCGGPCSACASSGCSGAEVGGSCWFLSAEGQSCNAACASHGGYDAATSTYAGSSGSLGNCDAVLNALGVPSDSDGSASASWSYAIGCSHNAYYGQRWRITSPATTEYGYVSGYKRACACNESGSAPAETCSDGIQNQGETGVDCGGPCAACAPAATCWDGIQNQGETGIDCGGPCAACAPAATCWDGIQNQGETGVDCGGPCAACSSGGSCDSTLGGYCWIFADAGDNCNEACSANGSYHTATNTYVGTSGSEYNCVAVAKEVAGCSSFGTIMSAYWNSGFGCMVRGLSSTPCSSKSVYRDTGSTTATAYGWDSNWDRRICACTN